MQDKQSLSCVVLNPKDKEDILASTSTKIVVTGECA
jgi:hypothetical protein